MPALRENPKRTKRDRPEPRILAPVDRVEEVELLAGAGAHELYGGVQPGGWGRGVLSSNQRTFASAHFRDEAAFAEAASVACRLGVGFHLTLNSPLYDPRAYPRLMALGERAAGWGVTGVIVGDLGLLRRLNEAKLPLVVTLSTMAGALNREAVGFYRRFGVERVVLPRHLGLSEMARLVEAHPELCFEAFILVGRCPNEEAFCTFQHVSPTQRWPCEISYDLVGPDEEELPADHPLIRWHYSWGQADRRHACGLCAVERLLEMGVGYLKIVGRGGPTGAKVANVELVSDFLRGRRRPKEAPEAYRHRFGRACHPLTCYFPEIRW